MSNNRVLNNESVKRKLVFEDDAEFKRKLIDHKTNEEKKSDEKNEECQLIPYADYVLEQNGMLCVFKSTVEQQPSSFKITWLDRMVYNLRCNNQTILKCYGSDAKYLHSQLEYLFSLYNMHNWHDKLYPEIDDKVVIVEPMGANKTTYNIGIRVKGKPTGFSFVDFGKLKRAKSSFGQFLSVQWNDIFYYNKIFGQIMQKYLKEDLPFKMESNACIHLSEKLSDKELFLKKFYNISRESNNNMYATNELIQPIEVTRTTMEQFDELFEMNKTEAQGPFQEVEVLICGVIEGVKYGKEIQMTDINNKKYMEKPYSLAFKPVLFFIIE
ncbi:dbp [Oxyplax ochracea nucleopolyhedrovirus]|uniref:Dbp n=1 Tax=Oxyplax ochracea nucleopolyhedrovirus TaxID=2083176 RepID=A0A2L0WU82_9ABAC|nr:dbp [Oxyplax ochracea nucleopolyhedrovirus]AVA31206.1 dbp [Oxyplax ochracea nucleopolyhedrovirus]